MLIEKRIMKRPFISIIVPVYNVEPYIEACIRSVMRQTYDGKMECIVVDDCGTDNSMVVVENVIADYNGSIVFKILHHDHNRGLSAARNTGVESAKGDYIFFLDSDDEMTTDCLNKLSEPLREKSYDIIVGMFENKDEDGTFNHGLLILPPKPQLDGNEILQSYCEGKLYSMVWNKLYPTSFLRSHGLRFLEGIIHEDELWTFQLTSLSRSLYVVSQTTYRYRRRNNSIMTSINLSNMINAEAYYGHVIEMGKFVKENHIINEIVYEIIRRRFYETLKLQINNPFAFIHYYRKMRQCTMKQLNDIYKKNFSYKRRIRDYHYYIPSMIASHCEYGVELTIILFRYLYNGCKNNFQ